MKLIAKAKSRPTMRSPKGSFTKKEDIELALAWVRDEVSLVQVAHAYDIGTYNASQIYSRLAQALRAHLRSKV